MPQYKKQYIKIYLWQSLSIFLGLATLFVVVPHLASDKITYGIYSVCTSLTIFLTYADLGFLSSGMKYAAEYYIKGDYKNEIKVVGFTAFFMFAISIVAVAGILILGICPQLLIPELEQGSYHYKVAQSLILILALGCPIMIAQRVLQIVYAIRVEDYKFQRLTICGNIVRILSVLYFFSNGNYRIVEYYCFYQLVGLLIVVVSLFQVKGYGYKLNDAIRAFRFDRVIFNQEKKLSFASLLFLVSMIFYNELDQIAISHIFGVEAVAIYATAFSILTLVRTFCGLVYSPYSSRYNHFSGLKDYAGLVIFTEKVLLLLSPITILPIINLSLYSEPFVISWVGGDYIGASDLMSFMVLSYAVNSLTQPLNCYMIACEKNGEIAIGGILLPVIYWLGILALANVLGVASFAVMKFCAPALLVFYYWHVITQDIKKRNLEFVSIGSFFKQIIPPIAFSVLIYFPMSSLMIYSHDKTSMAINILLMGLIVFMSCLVAVFSDKELHRCILQMLRKINTKI